MARGEGREKNCNLFGHWRWVKAFTFFCAWVHYSVNYATMRPRTALVGFFARAWEGWFHNVGSGFQSGLGLL